MPFLGLFVVKLSAVKYQNVHLFRVNPIYIKGNVSVFYSNARQLTYLTLDGVREGILALKILFGNRSPTYYISLKVDVLLIWEFGTAQNVLTNSHTKLISKIQTPQTTTPI